MYPFMTARFLAREGNRLNASTSRLRRVHLCMTLLRRSEC
jgi:hypothetical protein